MLNNQLNLNHLRIFESVYRTRSMTMAAKELHLTQSGVSQHMKSFESDLGISLFNRINQRLVPTQQASELYENCKNTFDALDRTVTQLKAQKKQISGRVVLGVPEEFANNVVVPLLSSFLSEHSEVKVGIKVGYGEEIQRTLLSGELDFAFLDELSTDKKLSRSPVFDECLELCVHEDYLKKIPGFESTKVDGNFKKVDFEKLHYVDYSKDEQLLRRWFYHHLKAEHLRLKTIAVIESTQSIAQLILNGVGAGILPDHLVKKLKRDRIPIVSFKGSQIPLHNRISLVQLKERTQSPAASAIMNFLKEEILSLQTEDVV